MARQEWVDINYLVLHPCCISIGVKDMLPESALSGGGSMEDTDVSVGLDSWFNPKICARTTLKNMHRNSRNRWQNPLPDMPIHCDQLLPFESSSLLVIRCDDHVE